MGGDLAYTTIETILNRLHSKELADRERVGRAFAYSPRFTEAELAARAHARHARSGQRP